MRDCTPGTLGQCRTGYICLDVSTDGSIGICYPNCNVNPTAICGAYQARFLDRRVLRGVHRGASTCSAGSSCNASTSRCECGPSTNCGAGYQCYPRSGARSAFLRLHVERRVLLGAQLRHLHGHLHLSPLPLPLPPRDRHPP